MTREEKGDVACAQEDLLSLELSDERSLRGRSRAIALVKLPSPGWLAVQSDEDLQAVDESRPPPWARDTLAQVARQDGVAVGRSQVRGILLAEGLAGAD